MERALALELLAAALDGRTGIPTAEELQRLMADAEVRLFLRGSQIAQEVLDAAWYLHAVASVNGARERYTLARQRQAFLVSAHIFDLALDDPQWSRVDRLSFGFAAAIGYRRGGRDPNATAIMNRLRADIDTTSSVPDHIDTLAIEAGLAFLGFETRTLFAWLRVWRRQLATLAQDSELPDLTTTVFGPTHLVVLGADDLLAYFARGNRARLERGQVRLRTVAIGSAGPEDVDARWVAAHLLALSGEADAGSLWNPTVLPPDVPQIVRQAFTMGSPPVLTLWEPQRDLLSGTQSPFDPRSRRLVLAVPTSGGKTLVAQMLAVEFLNRADRGVCYVAPTRSLGREVRRAMSNRARILQKETGADQPDFPTLEDFFASVESGPPADIEVMTPERLAHMLRHDPAGVLARFGMFIFDEAQLIKERGRGFTLESTIALLDYLTRETEHRIALISAAMGNGGAIAQWLSPDGEALLHESQWRGPRRLHAAFTTDPLWNTTVAEKLGKRATAWPYRLRTQLRGLIRLRMANGVTSVLSTTEDTGWRLVRASKTSDLRQTGLKSDPGRSTKQYMIASNMIGLLGHAGSVLVVASTRHQALLLAQGLASTLPQRPELAPLVDFVRLQLGEHHPLVDVLRHGVGFHHAGLPIEVLEALEEAVKDDLLPYLTCTSTLTDGVNLPVRTVVIYDQPYPGQPEDTRLRGARLVNAMGRAGRAGKETEGWIILVRGAPPTEADFSDLNPDAEQLAVTSSLTTDEALDAFAALEEDLRAGQDTLFQTIDPATTDFISFVWHVLAVEEGRRTDITGIDVSRIVDSTLAAQQAPAARDRCTRIARAVHSVYLATDSVSRQRWSRTGTSLGSARSIDMLASNLAATIVSQQQAGVLGAIDDPLAAIELPSMISGLLELREAPPLRFRVSVQGADIDVDLIALLGHWLSGVPMSELAEAHLAQAKTASWRVEQMVDAVTGLFEHYLAWTVGALVELINTRLDSAGVEARVCPELGAFIRYGIRDARALTLMTAGIRSRRLANAVASDVPLELEATREEIRSWLAGMGIAEWRTRFEASPSEVLDMLDFTRLRSRSLLRTLLEAGAVKVDLAQLPSRPPAMVGSLSLRPVLGEPEPAPFGLYAEEQLVATIGPQDHADVAAILNTGLDITITLDVSTDPPTVSVTLPLSESGDA